MILDKGGGLIENTVLFGKYQLIRTLGQGQRGTVYLVFHQELKEYRAMKQVPKSSAGYEQFKKEALLLTSLSHPGIPIVYDLEEDNSSSYLIEEYLEGDTLFELVKNQGYLNRETVLSIGIQVCDLVHYLHSAGQTPILYLDLQPKNLLFCHGYVKLLDFDHAGSIYEANESLFRYGTPGFCAPEQRTGGALGTYTDVYQIGALLYYLSTGHVKDGEDPIPDTALGRIIEICAREDKNRRYPSIPELKQQLETLYSQTGVFKNDQSSSLILALAGSRHGVGTTHLAIGLACCLNQAGYKTLYEERNPSGDVRAMALRCRSSMDSYGIYQVNRIPMKPYYGESVCLKPVSYPVVIRDYGIEWKTVREAEDIRALWLVHGGKWWEQEAGARAMGQLNQCQGFGVVYNRVISGMKPDPPQGIDRSRCLQAPYFGDPWKPGQQEKAFFENLAYMAGVFRHKAKAGEKREKGQKRQAGWKRRGIWKLRNK